MEWHKTDVSFLCTVAKDKKAGMINLSQPAGE